MYVYCAYMYSLYLCVHCLSVYRYVYSCVCSFLCGCNIEARRAFFACNLCNPYSMFLIKNLYSCFLPYLCSRFALSVPLPFLCLVPLAVRFPKRLRGSFYAVFRAVLSDPNFRRVLFYLLHRSSLSHGSKHGKTPLYGGGGPLGRGARGATDSPHNFLFFVPKNFFSGKFPLSFRFMPLVSMPKSLFYGSFPCLRTNKTS